MKYERPRIQNRIMTSDAENSRATSGRLEADRLAAAVNAVADLYDPDQIILFGSAARGGDDRGQRHRPARDQRPRTTPRRSAGSSMRVNGDRIDVVRMRREDLERQRRTAATIQEAALSQGITVLLKSGGCRAVATGQSWFTDESGHSQEHAS